MPWYSVWAIPKRGSRVQIVADRQGHIISFRTDYTHLSISPFFHKRVPKRKIGPFLQKIAYDTIIFHLH